MRYLTLIGICLLLCGSCGKRTIKVDRVMKRIIDTTAAPQIVLLRDELDSLCDLRRDSMIAVAVDSIMSVRRLEIQKITRNGK